MFLYYKGFKMTTTLRFVETRPSTDVPFYTYPEEYTALVQSRHSFTRTRVKSEDGLQATIELTFASVDESKAFITDPERTAQLAEAKAYNAANGIVAVVTRI